MANKRLVFINTVISLLYFLVLNFTNKINIFAFITIILFCLGVVSQTITFEIFKPHKKYGFRYSILGLIRIGIFLTLGFLSYQYTLYYRYHLSILIILINLSYDYFYYKFGKFYNTNNK